MALLITSASGASGNGFGALLAFELDGRPRGTFIDDDRIVDPRGLAVDPKENLLFLNSGADRVLAISSHGRVVRDTGRMKGLNPGGGNFGPDGRYFVGLRSTRTIIALSTSLDAAVERVLPPRVVPFPRGFAFGHDGRLFLASGIGPNGEGDNTVVAFTPGTPLQPFRLVADPELSPLDLAIAPNGNILVSSERPFGAADAVTSVREYNTTDGNLVRVFSPNGKAEFRKPRGLRFAPNGDLYCVARDEVVGFDFTSGKCLGAIV
jgi:WD40 repeat protein